MAATLCFLLLAYFFIQENGFSEADLGPIGLVFGISLLGTFAIGLPIALLTYALSGRVLAQSPMILVMTTALAAIMMVLASYSVADDGGVLIFGMPAAAAAMTFGLLGWIWIIRPLGHEIDNTK